MTEKMDGENTSMYVDHIHARSLDSKSHPSRAWVKQFHAGMRFDIPEGFRVCGENMFAKHSIHYANLPSYFLVFGVYDQDNTCLSWDETKDWCEMLGLHTVPELYHGPWDESLIKSLWTGTSTFGGEGEGYVVRVARSFPWSDYWECAAKCVRENHVTTSSHWMSEKVVPNLLYNQ